MNNSKTFLFLLMFGLFVNVNAQNTQHSESKQSGSIVNQDRLSIMLSDVLVRRLSMEYEHVLSNENMSLNIPFSVTLSPFNDLWADEVHWWLGMGIKFYPTGQGILRYFVGPEFRFISVTDTKYSWYYDSSNNYHDTSTTEKYINSAFLINNGLIYSPTNEFFVSLSMGLGFVSRNPDLGREVLLPYATPSFRLGFKF